VYSFPSRQLANRLTCERLNELIRGDSALVQQIIELCQAAAARQQRPDPQRIERLRTQCRAITSKILMLKADLGSTAEEQQGTQRIIGGLRSEQAQLQVELAVLEKAASNPVRVPSEDEVRAQLDRMADVLIAAGDGSPDEQGAARRIIDLLTGGRIDMYQQGERQPQHGWLQGRFHLQLVEAVADQLGLPGIVSAPEQGHLVVIDYREPDRVIPQALRAIELYEQHFSCNDIAQTIGISASWLSKLLKIGYEHLGRPKPNPYEQRAKIRRSADRQPLYHRIADEVMRLLDQGMMLKEIRERLGCSDTTLLKARAYWYESRNLGAPPDGRSLNGRRRQSGAVAMSVGA
jgi:hypothetical protein